MPTFRESCAQALARPFPVCTSTTRSRASPIQVIDRAAVTVERRLFLPAAWHVTLAGHTPPLLTVHRCEVLLRDAVVDAKIVQPHEAADERSPSRVGHLKFAPKDPPPEKKTKKQRGR